MDKEELYEKVIKLMERVRELEQIIEDDRDDLDDTNKRLSDAEAENQSLKEENAELRKAIYAYNGPDVMKNGETVHLLPKIRLPEPMRFLGAFLEENGITADECAKLCGVHPTTIKRLSKGYRCENPTFDKVVHGLGLTAEQATEFRKSLTKKQRQYGKPKAKALTKTAS